jgi:ABC-type multidrug transport system, ATPase component
MNAISAEGLVKIYRSRKSKVRRSRKSKVRALDGAGKTTTVWILATLLKPDAGHGTVAGFDMSR